MATGGACCWYIAARPWQWQRLPSPPRAPPTGHGHKKGGPMAPSPCLFPSHRQQSERIMSQQRQRRLLTAAMHASVETGSTSPPVLSLAETSESGQRIKVPEDSCVSVYKPDNQRGTLSEAECIKTLRLLGWVQIGPYELRKPRWRSRGEM